MRKIDLNGKNKYYTLYKSIQGEILSGRIRAGQRLPSKRALAQETGVSVVTVQLAYEQLLAEGYITSRQRSGYFAENIDCPAATQFPTPKHRYPRHIPAPMPENAEQQRYILDLVKGYAPAELFPFSTWAKLMRTVLADCGEHLLERVPCCGDIQLQNAVAAYLYRARGISVEPQHIIIGAGAEHLYGVLVQLLGRGKLFAAEAPCYGKIPAVYTLYGAEVAHVAVTEAGIDLDEVEKLSASAVHVSPSHQFPTGAVMPATARSRLIAWANKADGYIIEDDYDSEFRLEGRPLQSLAALCPDRVIYINTFSKSLAPSMRLGYMVLPPALYGEYLRLYGQSANIVPLFEQKTLALMLDGGYFERLISRLKNHYRGIRKRILQMLCDLCPECEISDNGGGAHFTVKFQRAQSDLHIKQRAEELGIKIKCLCDYLPQDPLPKAGGEYAERLHSYQKTAVINYSGVTHARLDAIAQKLQK